MADPSENVKKVNRALADIVQLQDAVNVRVKTLAREYSGAGKEVGEINRMLGSLSGKAESASDILTGFGKRMASGFDSGVASLQDRIEGYKEGIASHT